MEEASDTSGEYTGVWDERGERTTLAVVAQDKIGVDRIREATKAAGLVLIEGSVSWDG